jgi:hypothetical protein
VSRAIAREAYGPAPNRAEIATANADGLITRLAVMDLQLGVDRWATRWASQLSMEALRELYETIGLRKVKR